MNYVLLIYLDQERWAQLSTEERNRVHTECGAWHDDLVRRGKSRGATGLQPISTATTLVEENGKVVVMDGPFAETREILGGFEALQCDNLDEAMAIARRFPALRVGSKVELRPEVIGMCQD